MGPKLDKAERSDRDIKSGSCDKYRWEEVTGNNKHKGRDEKIGGYCKIDVQKSLINGKISVI